MNIFCLTLLLISNHKLKITMKLQNVIILSLFLSVAISSCSSKSDSGTVKTGDAMDAAAAEATAITFDVNTAESGVTWDGYKPNGKHNGTIGIKGGSLSVENGTITAGNFVIDITSLAVLDIPADDENNAKLRGHLMSDDFFDAENFPEATFEVVSIKEFEGDSTIEDQEQFESEFTPAAESEILVDNATHMITGNLTMRGVTKSVEIPAAVSVTDTEITAEANFNIDRTEWNLAYGDEANAVDKAKDKFIYNTVTVGFTLKASPATAAM